MSYKLRNVLSFLTITFYSLLSRPFACILKLHREGSAWRSKSFFCPIPTFTKMELLQPDSGTIIIYLYSLIVAETKKYWFLGYVLVHALFANNCIAFQICRQQIHHNFTADMAIKWRQKALILRYISSSPPRSHCFSLFVFWFDYINRTWAPGFGRQISFHWLEKPSSICGFCCRGRKRFGMCRV